MVIKKNNSNKVQLKVNNGLKKLLQLYDFINFECFIIGNLFF